MKMILLTNTILKNVLLYLVVFFTFINGLGQDSKSLVNQYKEISQFVDLIYTKDTLKQNELLHYIADNWKSEYEIMILELAYFNANNEFGGRLMDVLNEKSGQYIGYSINEWYRYLWSKPQKTVPNYGYFKAELYTQVDPRFERYFLGREKTSEVRLDEIRWGGVLQDGIPPLRHPEMIQADEATYLGDDHIVFGIEINGDFRAYPKRILSWHELFTDTVGGEPVTGVYCTLCGTVVLYKSTHQGMQYHLGTSGFLFRSNKLMYDQKTQSLWNTLWGQPVLGPLAGKGIKLEYISVVTTTWGQWKKQHPTTTVLSLNTGHQRDYGEGVAYHDYFANDALMFAVPSANPQNIKNKQSVLALRLQQEADEPPPVALSVKFLKKHPLYHCQIGDAKLLILTDKTGANRVYDAGDRTFKKYVPSQQYVIDKQGQQWMLSEGQLKNEQGLTLKRFPAFNAFWFGWQAAYPNTVLVK